MRDTRRVGIMYSCVYHDRSCDSGTRARETGGGGGEAKGQAEVPAGLPAEWHGHQRRRSRFHRNIAGRLVQVLAVHPRQAVRREAAARGDCRVARAARQEARDHREVRRKQRPNQPKIITQYRARNRTDSLERSRESERNSGLRNEKVSESCE